MSAISDWEEKTFSELGHCIRGVSYKPAQLQEAVSDSSVTLLRSNNIRDGKLNFHNLQFVDKGAVRDHQRLQSEDIAICMSNGNRALVGKSGQFLESKDSTPHTVGAFCSIFRPSKEYDPRFIRHLFGSDKYQRQLDGILAGSAINNLKGSDIEGLVAVCPTFKPEQTKIAEVLSTVDRAIEQTEALIAKQQRIKTGLMQDLLTRGIDEHGKLRSEETHEFKDTPLGRISVEWDVVKLEDVLETPPRNGIYKPADKIGWGTLLIGQTSFTEDRRINYELARRAEISPAELKAFGLRNSNILVTRVFATVEGVGRPVLVSELPEPAVYESNMLCLRVNEAKMTSYLLFQWLRSTQIRKRITSAVNASNQTSVNQKVLNELPVPLLGGDEQRRIAETISTQEKQLKESKTLLFKLHSLKTGLMQDLITGKKPITALLNEKEVVSA